MRKIIFSLITFVSLQSCGKRDPFGDGDKHCRGETCYIDSTITPTPRNPCQGSWTTTTNCNSTPPGSGSDRPLFGGGSSSSGGEEKGSYGPAKPVGCIGECGENSQDAPPPPPSNEGGHDKGGTLAAIGRGIADGWEGIKGVFNGGNKKKREEARKAKALLEEANDIFEQVDGYSKAIREDQNGIETAGKELNKYAKALNDSASDQAFRDFRDHYNSRVEGILENTPNVDEGNLSKSGQGRAGSTYESQKIANGRSYVSYASEKVESFQGQSDFPARRQAIETANAALDEAEESYRAGNPSEGNLAYEVAMVAADLAISVNPVTGFIKDSYELVSGRSALTGQKLTNFERSLAAVGVLTLGVGSQFMALGKVAKLGKIFARSAKGADEVAQVAKSFERGSDIAHVAAKNGIKDRKVIDRLADLAKDGMPCRVANLSPLRIFLRLIEDVAYAADCMPGSVEERIKEILAAPEKLGWQGKAAALEDLSEAATSISKEGKLPSNYITKEEAIALGWDSTKGNLHEIAPGKMIGGGAFRNSRGKLPEGKYLEADLGYRQGYRGTERMVYSDKGERIYITNDHYETFLQVK